MSVLKTLTEGIVERDLAQEGKALLSKWERTGLLEGLTSDYQRQSMSRLLENQAKQLLKEASSMAAGDVEGFSAVAFPIVRRVFGGLVANDIVSVQPMSLPSGLIFFLDFTYEAGRFNNTTGKSIYGTDRVASQLTGGVNITDSTGLSNGGPYLMGGTYSSPTGSATVQMDNVVLTSTQVTSLTDANKKLIDFDPDILADSANRIAIVKADNAITTDLPDVDVNQLPALVASAGTYTSLGNGTPVRRLYFLDADNKLNMVLVRNGGAITDPSTNDTVTFKYPRLDNFNPSSTLGAVVGADPWGLEGAGENSPTLFDGKSRDEIPEIDIKVDSIAVTAQTKKLKAKWSPELGQDLNAYHNLDAEVELTSILSEQIALEIDRELLNDLLQGATAATRYWSRSPGLFVDRTTGAEVGATSSAPDFTGTVSEWYETLVETINDVSAEIHVKTLRGGANFIVCSPQIANILEFTSGFRASVTADVAKGDIGAVKTGSLSKKFDVYVDPYFLKNVILVGRKGSSFLESGFVYAPYVPLQVTPTIFGVEDFVPRKGVMTRYAKKMVRPDMYGLVVCRGLNGEGGS